MNQLIQPEEFSGLIQVTYTCGHFAGWATMGDTIPPDRKCPDCTKADTQSRNKADRELLLHPMAKGRRYRVITDVFGGDPIVVSTWHTKQAAEACVRVVQGSLDADIDEYRGDDPKTNWQMDSHYWVEAVPESEW